MSYFRVLPCLLVQSLRVNFHLIERWDVFTFCTLHIEISDRALLKRRMVDRLCQEISKQNEKKQNKTNFTQVHLETQYEQETLLLAIGKKNDFKYIPDVHVLTSDFLVKFLKRIIRQR